MTTVMTGEEMDIHDTFESDIQLAATPSNGQLAFRLERPDGTLAVDANLPDAEIIDMTGNKYGVQFRVDMPGVWYFDWKPDGSLAAFVQGWFRVVDTYIGKRTIP